MRPLQGITAGFTVAKYSMLGWPSCTSSFRINLLFGCTAGASERNLSYLWSVLVRLQVESTAEGRGTCVDAHVVVRRHGRRYEGARDRDPMLAIGVRALVRVTVGQRQVALNIACTSDKQWKSGFSFRTSSESVGGRHRAARSTALLTVGTSSTDKQRFCDSAGTPFQQCRTCRRRRGALKSGHSSGQHRTGALL